MLDAALALVSESGLRAVTIEAIGHRAGVAATTVYRRFPTVDDVLLALVERVYQDITVPDTGSVRRDLVEMSESIDENWRRPGYARFLAALVAVMADNQRIADAYARNYEARRARTREIVERGKRRGELRADVDADLVLDAMTGIVTVRMLFRQVPAVTAEQVIATVLDGAWARGRG